MPTQRFLTETLLPAGSLKLRVARTASGDPPMVMLHGVTRRWQSFLPVVSSFSTRFQLNLVDLRGHGGSERSSRYLVVDFADDLVELLHASFPDGVVLYGHSLGSMVAAAVAARAPELVKALILEDPPFHTMGDRIRETVLHSYFGGLAQLLGNARSFAELHRLLPDVRVVDPKSGQSQRVRDIRDAAFIRFTAQSLSQLDPRVLDPIVAGEWLAGYNVGKVVQGIVAPTLTLRADADFGGMLTANDAQWMQQVLPSGSQLYYPGGTHLLHWSRTQDLANHVLGFLASLDD